ncbi:FAD-dependent oxidoreductase [Methylophilaceae bacterium]|nr:FAD-dependent oxidoreductase [Methylophilaceae bacterium]MDC1173427.1 FAD-dependent oxidoreductase [Methylophilaceae bacterium]|tara:strand:- start:1973 stop:3214 length:1242 start_codon:yes stop_codon:yes gene_type:complete
MKIAIVGAGISGNAIAHLLHKEHKITLFEKNDRIGGHSHTHKIQIEDKTISVDTGFIVFNKKTYPLFTSLLDKLGVDYEDSNMSFSVFSKLSGLEYNGTNLNTLFSQRKNLFNFKFIKMVLEIFRFNKKALELLSTKEEITLGDYLANHNYSSYFSKHYILPMGSAIWSSNIETMLNFPAKFFVKFFHNHGMLNINDRPQWLTITGGSESYVKKLCEPFINSIKLNSNIRFIERMENKVIIHHNQGSENFDYLFMACHSNEALKLIKDTSYVEKELLGSIPYADNDVYLHTDASIMPKHKLSWAAWNYNIDNKSHEPISLTYNMNILQNIKSESPVLVTLNPKSNIDPKKIIKKLNYSHPTFNIDGINAQKKHHLISGVNRTFYAGAYWGNGFHEDGVKSAYDVVNQLNKLIN